MDTSKLPGNIIALQDEDEYYNLLIYADSGVGKTVFGCSDDDVLVVAPEDNGTLSAKRFGSSALKWKVEKWEDIAQAYKWLEQQDPIPFNWVFLDSLTEMQSMCMRSVLDEALKMNPARDPDVPQIGDWQPYYGKFERMVKLFNNLDVNVLYSALQQDEENEDGEKVVLPMLQGKGTQFAKKVASWMTSFGHMRVARKKGEVVDGEQQWEEFRVIQWRASKTVMAKDRTRCLEPRTIIGEGHLGGLKEVRELLENGPRPTVQPGRVVPKKTANKVVRKKAVDDAAEEAESDDGEVVQLVSFNSEDEE